MTTSLAGRAGIANPKSLVLSSRHRRTVWGNMDSLTASVRAHGVIAPLAVRPHRWPDSDEGPFEIIYGARRQRASITAKLDEVPILILLVDAKTATEMQYAENHEREGLHPLDEGDLFADLLDFGYDIKGIAKKFNVPRYHVETRLQLRRLSAPIRAAFAEGDVGEDMAEVIAVMPLESQQVAVLEAVRAGALTDPDEVRAWVRRHLIAPLAGVPWDLVDGAMPGGSCARCPKNSGSQREIFQTIAGKEDMCLDVACRGGKMDVAWQRTVDEAARRPNDRAILAELDTIEVDDLFVPRAGGAHGVVRASGFVDAVEECPHAPGKTWYDAAVAAGVKPMVYLARDQEGRPRQLLKEGDVARLVKASVKEAGSALADQDAAIDPARAAQRLRASKLRETTAELVAKLLRGVPEAAERGVLAAAVDALETSVLSASSLKVVRTALGVEPDKALAAAFATASATPTGALVALVAAMVVAELGAARPPVPGVAALAEICGVDLS